MIGMLGRVMDEAAMRIAVHVYELLVDSDGRIRPEHSARALHTALQEELAAWASPSTRSPLAAWCTWAREYGCGRVAVGRPGAE